MVINRIPATFQGIRKVTDLNAILYPLSDRSKLHHKLSPETKTNTLSNAQKPGVSICVNKDNSKMTNAEKHSVGAAALPDSEAPGPA